MKAYGMDVLGLAAPDPRWPFAEFSKNALYANSDLALRTKRVKNLPLQICMKENRPSAEVGIHP